MRYGQLVMGPAGSGKSTYCSTLVNHAKVSGRRMDVINLDPAADGFTYEPLADVRDLIQVEDVMEDDQLRLGPNGSLVFCWEFLLDNMDWLRKELQGAPTATTEAGEEDDGDGAPEAEVDDDYILFDCPGQIELYTHMKVVKKFVDILQNQWNFRLCGVFLIDSHFMVDGSKFLSGSMSALSCMINLELSHVNILSKVDLLSPEAKKQLDSYLEPDTLTLLTSGGSQSRSAFEDKYHSLSEALARVLDDYSLVKYFPLDINDEENIGDLLITIDNVLQYGEEADVNTKDFDEYNDALETEQNEEGA